MMAQQAHRRRADVQATDAHIRRALAYMRTPSWPPTDEEALAHRVIGPCVHALALTFARRDLLLAEEARKPLHRIGQRPPRGASWCRSNPAPAYDAKRAAANDLDDDDE